MKQIITRFFILIAIGAMLTSCGVEANYDVAIAHVDVYNSITKSVDKNKTVLIDADTIAVIQDANESFKATKIIQGNNRLMTPGFVDTHIHFTDVYGDYGDAPEYLPVDSLNVYRKKLADAYLAYGTTTLRIAGQPEKWIEPTLEWQLNPTPNFPDVYISGGALISDEERRPYINHAEVVSPEDAKAKVEEYYAKGIRHIKLYWRLRYPEIKAAIDKANALGMTVCGHIDQNVANIDSTLDLGLINYEHACSPLMSVFEYDTNWPEFLEYVAQMSSVDHLSSNYFAFMMDVFGFVNQHSELKPKLDTLIQKMAKNNASICSTTHLFAEKVELSYFTNESMLNDTNVFPEAKDIKRYKTNFKAFMEVVKQMHETGVKLTIGTDCKEGGKAALSEMMLFYEAGFSIADILQIATMNGAEVIGLSDKYGSIEVGKKANFILFESSPFDDYNNFLSEKTIIKDGIIYSTTNP